MSLQAEIQHHAVVMLRPMQLLKRLLGRIDCGDLDVLVRYELDYRFAAAFRRPRRRADASEHPIDEMRDFRERILECFLADGLGEICHCARLESLLTTLDSADDVNRNVTSARVPLQTLENFHPVHARHVDVERDRVGTKLLCSRKSAVAIECDNSLESFSRAMPSRIFAKLTSFSMIRTVRSPGSISRDHLPRRTVVPGRSDVGRRSPVAVSASRLDSAVVRGAGGASTNILVTRPGFRRL